MKELKQLYFHKPEQGEIRDCWRTCIACLLDLSNPVEVPHYYEDFQYLKSESETVQLTQQETNVWLKKTHGVVYVEYPIVAVTLENLRTYIAAYYKNLFVMVGCNSKHGGHSVIMQGNEYLWDPSKDDSGCAGPMDDGYYWIGVLVRAP